MVYLGDTVGVIGTTWYNSSNFNKPGIVGIWAPFGYGEKQLKQISLWQSNVVISVN